MTNKLVFAIVISVIAIAAIVAGCTTPTATPTPVPTEVATPTATPGENVMPAPAFGEADNGKNVEVATGTIFNVSLAENPTTGYSWNVTLTPGLDLVNTSFAANETAGLAGAGGVRTWELKTTNGTTQTFTAVYTRPFEPTTGNETTYVLNITAPAAAEAVTTYTEADDNKTVTMAKGNTIAVMLSENPSTGYSWNTTATSGLTVNDTGYVQNPAPEGMVGVGGNHTWQITATGEDNQTFSGVYKQPWMPASPTDKTFTLNIVIS